MTRTATDVAVMVILVVGNAVTDVSSDDIRACACECAIDESCYSCNDCNDNPECAC